MDKVAQIITYNKTEEVAVNFKNPTQGPTMMYEHSLSIKFIIKGQEVAGSIVDGGSGLNIINKQTCEQLKIKWETCQFQLRMTNTSFVRLLGLIRYLDIIIGGHTFQISTVVLKSEAQGVYPLFQDNHGRRQQTSNRIGGMFSD